MKLYRLFTVTATALALASTASAQSKGAGAAKAPHVASSVAKGGNTTHGPKAGTPTGSGKSANAGSSKKSAEGSSHAKNSGAPAADAPANTLATKITNNPAQLAKIQPQLDALGLTLDDATKGFRNQGQFIAALNAATHRNLDFVALQEAMTVDGLSLGQAAKELQNAAPEPETPAAQAPASTGTTTSPTGAPAQ